MKKVTVKGEEAGGGWAGGGGTWSTRLNTHLTWATWGLGIPEEEDEVVVSFYVPLNFSYLLLLIQHNLTYTVI